MIKQPAGFCLEVLLTALAQLESWELYSVILGLVTWACNLVCVCVTDGLHVSSLDSQLHSDLLVLCAGDGHDHDCTPLRRAQFGDLSRRTCRIQC